MHRSRYLHFFYAFVIITGLLSSIFVPILGYSNRANAATTDLNYGSNNRTGCASNGSVNTNRTSPSPKTPGLCLGYSADSGTGYYQFAVNLPGPVNSAVNSVSAVNVTGTDGAGHIITFVQDTTTRFVSLAGFNGDTKLGWASVGWANTCSSSSPLNNITITTTNGLNKSQQQIDNFNLCDSSSDDATFINKDIDPSKIPPTGAVATTGSLSGFLCTTRSDITKLNDNNLNSYITGNAEKKAVTSIVVSEGPTNLQGDNNSSWYSLSGGVLNISGLAQGTYKIVVIYNDKANVPENIAQYTGSVTFTLNTVVIVNGQVTKDNIKHSCTDANSASQASVSDPGGSGSSVSSCSIDGIGWIVCPVVTFLGSIADGMYTFLADNFLQTDVSTVATNNSNGTYVAWAVMRNIANVAFVIIFLIIIFSQIANVGISNYGIKKMLPRLIVAAIMVNLSFFICQIAVDLSNILGHGIKGVFDNIGATIVAPAGSSTDVNGVTGFDIWKTLAAGALIGVGGAIVYASLSTLLVMLIGALVSLLIIFLMLILRQMLIILLIVIAPLAFVAFLLPNTQSLFKRWRTLFTGLLILYPIIGLVFGASSLASTILSNTYKTSGNSIGQIIAAGVLVIPLFIVPFILKSSLSGIGKLGNTINSIGSKAGGSAGKAGAKVYGNTALGRGQEIKRQAKQNYRNQKFARSIGKNGPRKFFASALPITKSNREANKALSRYSTAATDKAASEDISSEQSSLQNRIQAGTITSETALTTAIKNGDTVAARAALNIQFQTAGGRTKAHAIIRDAENTGVLKGDIKQTLQKHISTAHPNMDAMDNSLSRWGHNELKEADGITPSKLGRYESDIATYSLNDQKMSGQALPGLIKAYSSGSLDMNTADRILSSEALSKDLKPPERAALETIRSGGTPIGGPTF